MGGDQSDMRDVLSARECPIRFVPVRAKYRILCQDRLEHFGDRDLAEVCQHFVRHLSVAISCDQNRDLLLRQPPLRGLAAPLAGSALQVPRIFERFQEEGLVGLDYPFEATVLPVPQPTQESVTPAETGGGVDPAFSGRFADTQTINYSLGIRSNVLLE